MTNDELVRMWNERLMALFDVISQHMPGWIKKKSVTTVEYLDHIRYPPNKSQKCHCFSQFDQLPWCNSISQLNLLNNIFTMKTVFFPPCANWYSCLDFCVRTSF